MTDGRGEKSQGRKRRKMEKAGKRMRRDEKKGGNQ